MQVRRRVAMVAATLALVISAGAAVPVAAETPLLGLSRYWKVDKNGVKGLVAVNTPNGVDLELAFQLWGLQAKASYILRGSSTPCSQAEGSPLFQRGFTTNAKGAYWDPVVVPADISDIASVRLIRKRSTSSSQVLCVNSSSGASGFGASVAVSKLIGEGVRGIAVVDETSTRRTIVALSGLRSGVRHAIILRTGDCASGTGGSLLHDYRVTPGSSGRVLLERFVVESATASAVPAGLGGESVAGSVRVKRGSTTLACATPLNSIV
jgi:hypothetical protein